MLRAIAVNPEMVMGMATGAAAAACGLVFALKDRLFASGLKEDVITFAGTMNIVGALGKATFYLTDDGTMNGNSVFPTAVFKPTARFWIDDDTIYSFSGYTLSGDRKTLEITVKKQNKISAGLLGIGVEVLIPTMTPAPAATPVNLVIRGN